MAHHQFLSGYMKIPDRMVSFFALTDILFLMTLESCMPVSRIGPEQVFFIADPR